MNEESGDLIDQNEAAGSSHNVELRGKVAWDIAKKLEKPPLDESAPEQERADREALEAVRGKFVKSFEGENDESKVSVPLAETDLEIIKKNLPQPGMGTDARVQHELLDELETGYKNTVQNEWIREKSSGILGKAKQLFMKLFFH